MNSSTVQIQTLQHIVNKNMYTYVVALKQKFSYGAVFVEKCCCIPRC